MCAPGCRRFVSDSMRPSIARVPDSPGHSVGESSPSKRPMSGVDPRRQSGVGRSGEAAGSWLFVEPPS